VPEGHGLPQADPDFALKRLLLGQKFSNLLPGRFDDLALVLRLVILLSTIWPNPALIFTEREFDCWDGYILGL
jgi:hypothetical protein